MPNENRAFALLLWIVFGLFLFRIAVGFALRIIDFKREIRYIKIEIGRTTGMERRYWIRQKHRLWLSLIPFVPYRQG